MFKKKNLFLILSLAIFVWSCEPEDFGIESDDPRDNIVDLWNVTEYSLLDTVSYVSEISKHPSDSTKVIISYFYGLGYDINAIATQNNRSLSISEQILDGIKIKGQGSANSSYSEITFNYTADDGSGFIDQVKAVYTR